MGFWGFGVLGFWGKTEAIERRKLINRIADLLEKNIVELATLETLDNGKPVFMAQMDVGFSIEILRYYAGWTDKIMG